MTSPHSPNAPVATVREAREDDLPRLLELFFQLSQLGESPERTVEPLEESHHTALRTMHADPRTTCYVLEVDGQVHGSLTLYILPNLSHRGHPAAIVENVVVDSALRGGGYGRLLMAHAEAIARQRGCYKVALTSNRRRADAHRFYEGIGYVESHKGFTKYDRGQRAEGRGQRENPLLCPLPSALCPPSRRLDHGGVLRF